MVLHVTKHRLQQLLPLTGSPSMVRWGQHSKNSDCSEVGALGHFQARVVRLELVGQLLRRGVVARAVRLPHLQPHELLLPHVIRLAHVRVHQRIVCVCGAASTPGNGSHETATSRRNALVNVTVTDRSRAETFLASFAGRRLADGVDSWLELTTRTTIEELR